MFDEYFESLYTRLGRPGNEELLLKLYLIPYEYSVPLDENRVADVYDLLNPPFFKKDDVSVLEVLIALAIRAEQISGDEFGMDYVDFAWEFIYNLVGTDKGNLFIDTTGIKDIEVATLSWMHREGHYDIFPHDLMKRYHKSKRYWGEQLFMQLNHYLEELSHTMED